MAYFALVNTWKLYRKYKRVNVVHGNVWPHTRTHTRTHTIVVETERERGGFPVCPTNEMIPHADTEHRIRRTRELQRTNAIGADEDAGDSAIHRQSG